MGISEKSDALTYLTWLACRNHDVPSRDLMLSGCGRIALAVGMGPLPGMSREMVFVKSGLTLGLISPVNDPVKRIEEGQVLFDDGRAAADTAMFGPKYFEKDGVLMERTGY